HDENPMSPRGRGFRWRGRCGFGLCAHHGQSYREAAALSDSVTGGGNSATVQFHQPFREREPDAEASLRAFHAAIHLREELEDLVELLGRNSEAAVLDGHDDVFVLPLGSHADTPALRRELDCIA